MQSTNSKIYGILLGLILVIAVPAMRSGASGVVQPPERVFIDALAAHYEPVLFDHALHDFYASCVECHHHTIGQAPSDPACLLCHSEGRQVASVGCRDCHLADRYGHASHSSETKGPSYHDDVPGLIGAYHLNCISCHQAIGTGPVGCESCHVRGK